MHQHLLAETTVNVGGLWLALVLVLVFAVLGVIGWRAKRREIIAFRSWAARYGYRYERRDDSVAGVSSAPPFELGRDSSCKCMDVFRGEYKNMHIVFFRYDYQSTAKDRPVMASYQVVAIGLPGPLPVLDVGREDFLSRWGKDVDFENQRFNDTFKIHSSDRRFASDVIHPRMMEWMLADRRAQTYRWRFDGPWLLSFRSGRVDLADVFARADFLIDVYAQVPRHVWSNA